MADITGSCGKCGKEWSSLTEAHCPSCCAHFTSDSAFNRHLAPVQAMEPCHDPAEMRDKKRRKVFEQVQRKHGLVWRVRKFGQPHPFAANDFRVGVSGPNGVQVDDGAKRSIAEETSRLGVSL